MEGAEGDEEREAINFAFVNGQLITSRLHLQTAISQALLSESQQSLRTKTVHSEIIWILNPTNNITESLRRYGISESTTSLLVVRIAGPEMSYSDVQAKMNAVVNGQLQPLNKLQELTDWDTVMNYHKLQNERGIREAKDNAHKYSLIDNIVISTVAMKSVMG